MRRPWLQNRPINLLFGLTDESVPFRNRWRSLVSLSAWLLLSGMTMVLSLFSVQERQHIAVVIAMSLIKYVPLLIIIYSFARRNAARYLDDIYELHNEDLADHFLEDLIFGNGRRMIVIREGRISEQDERSPLILIGGPGFVQVNLDSVALLEKVDGEPEVIYPRREAWKLGRFERIREIGRHDEVGQREYAIINLRDQFVSGLTVKTRTKDGIPIEAQDIKVIFSILRRAGQENSAMQGDSYLFDPAAVESLVYHQTLITPEPETLSGISFPWNTTVIPLVYSELEDLITSRTLSEILASIGQKEVDQTLNTDQTIENMRVRGTRRVEEVEANQDSRMPNFESRSKITAQFYDSTFREKAARLGISVEWIDIGTWQLPSDLIVEKHREAWTLSRENATRRAAIEQIKRKAELEEIIKLVEGVVIHNYEGKRLTDKDSSTILNDPDLRRQVLTGQGVKKQPLEIASDMLRAFRKELLAARLRMESQVIDSEKNRTELVNIEKALIHINYLMKHTEKG